MKSFGEGHRLGREQMVYMRECFQGWGPYKWGYPNEVLVFFVSLQLDMIWFVLRFFLSHLEENPATVKPPSLQQNISWNDMTWPCYYRVGSQYHPISRAKALQLGLRTRKKMDTISTKVKSTGHHGKEWEDLSFLQPLVKDSEATQFTLATNFSAARYENERRHQTLGLKRGQCEKCSRGTCGSFVKKDAIKGKSVN